MQISQRYPTSFGLYFTFKEYLRSEDSNSLERNEILLQAASTDKMKTWTKRIQRHGISVLKQELK